MNPITLGRHHDTGSYNLTSGMDLQPSKLVIFASKGEEGRDEQRLSGCPPC
jgi:hypothetical protein